MTEHTDDLTPLISRYFEIEKVIGGGGDLPYLTRYEGRLRVNSERAYDELTAALKPQKLAVIFLKQKNTQVIQVLQAPRAPRRSNPWINLILFVVTAISVIYTGARFSFEGSEPSSLAAWLPFFISGIPFAACLLAILLAHEFGHYLAARYHKTSVTLPYFLPLPAPLSPFGTLGAFIQLKEQPKNKKTLFDVGVAGPLAGLVVAIPVLLVGLSLSTVDKIPAFIPAGSGFLLEGNSILYLFSKYLVFHQWLPSPESFGSVTPFVYWVRYFFTGLPTPLGALDVTIHPIAWAGWTGLLVTALNLIPAGQLDGGHVLYTLVGKRANFAVPFILIGLGFLGLFWEGWWLWVFLIFFLGRTFAQPMDQITNLDWPRRVLGIITLIIFVLVFIPIPLKQLIGPFGGP